MLPAGCSDSLLRISVIISEAVLRPLFVQRLPLNTRGLTKRKTPLKDPITLPLCTLKLTL